VPHIRKVLIANRGEIARRIRRTASEMGIKTVAAYTAAERDAAFVTGSDDGVLLPGSGPAPYLDIGGLIEVARLCGADAVHPGYGFLAENADFAEAVIAEGLTWVGPPARAIARMGDKIEAKQAAMEAGVPILEADAATVSFPAIVKAAAGGGGKGMRVVESADELDDAIAAAQREAERAFGDPTTFIEPYLHGARHIEIQILGDAHGNLIHLFERECSIQRRHQKVVEEAPSSVVDDDLRARMGEAAVSLAKAIGYRNAGTVEFLLDREGSFYFMEMNTRLQVEHPVTEEITFTDLVHEQLLEAMGEPISVDQPTKPIGHAIEVRLNAEDPAHEFLPATGTLVGWEEPDDHFIRIESGVRTGSVVGTAFDPLLAKFIASAETRREAALHLALALERTTIQGVRTNRDLLVALLRSREFLAGETSTHFLETVPLPGRRELSEDEVHAALAAVALSAAREARGSARTLHTFPMGWRNSAMPAQRRILVLDEEIEETVEYKVSRSGEVTINSVAVHLGDDTVEVDGRSTPVKLNRDGESWWVHGPWGDVEVRERSPFPTSEIEEEAGSLHAPMPGNVVSVAVKAGDTVRKGQTLVVLEAMKMEHPIGSPEDGVVEEVKVSPGDQVERGAVLVVVESALVT
jgi:propionyl-CoA carboxylase alpha chain